MVGAQVHQHQEGVLPFAHVRISLNLLKPHLLANRLRLFSDIILLVMAESAVRGSLIFPVKLFTMGLIRFQYLFQQTWELDSLRLDYLGIRGFVQFELLAE